MKYFSAVKPVWFVVGMIYILTGCDASNNESAVTIDMSQTLDERQLSNQENQSTSNVINFGFAVRSSPQEDARQYLPFLTYLEKQTGYKFRLRFTPPDSSTITELGEQKVLIAAMGASEYLKAKEKYNVNILVRGLNNHNKAEYQSFIVVPPNSQLTSITQLKNKRFAFGSKSSTQGHLIPLIILNKNNITLKEFKSYVYAGSHFNCANLVISGKADACGMQDTMAKSMAKKGLVKILYESNYFPSSGIVIHNSIDKEKIKRIKKALLNFKPKSNHQVLLYNWDKTEMPNGFSNAIKTDYNELHDAMHTFGLMKK